MRYRYPIRVLIHIAVLVLAPIAFASLLFVTPYLAAIKYIIGSGMYAYISKPLLFSLPILSSIIIFTLFNYFLPNAVVRLKYAFISGLYTSALFFFAKRIFSLYVKYFNYNKLIYGALATVPLFLAWLFVCWLIILSGTLLCNIISVGLDNSIARYSTK